MNIFKKTFRDNRKALLIWALALAALVATGMGKQTAMGAEGDSFSQLMNSMPRIFMALIGIGNLDITSTWGMFGIIVYYVAIAGAIYAVNLGVRAVAGEENDNTAEFLLAKPVSRSAILTQKLLAQVLAIALLNVVLFGVSLALVPDAALVASCYLSVFVVMLVFLSIGACLGAVSVKKAGAYAGGLVGLAYVAGVFYDMFAGAAFLRFLSPLKFYDMNALVTGGGLDLGTTLYALVITGVLLVLCYTAYQRRDIRCR